MRKLDFHAIHIDHPSGRERASNPEAESTVSLTLLNGRGSLEVVPLDELALVKVIAQASRALAVLKGIR